MGLLVPEHNETPHEYIRKTKETIRKLRTEKPSVMSTVLGYAALPVTWAIGVLVPQPAIEGALAGLDWCAKNTVTVQSAGDPENLTSCDASANQVITIHAVGGAVEGGAAGFFGIFALPLDIPAVIALAMRTTRQVGIEYGYGADTEDERQFVLNVLRAAGANSMAEKAEALVMSAYLTNILMKQTFKAMAAKATANPIGGEAAILGMKALAKQLGINLTKRKALAVLPGIGTVVSASVNGWFIREVGVAAQRLYQERWLRERGLLIDGEILS